MQFKKLKLMLVLLFFAGALQGQTENKTLDSNSIYDYSLEELMNLKSSGEYPSELESLINSLLSVSSVQPLSASSSPNVVSYITEEVIQKSGARDLVDVLRMVPGFDFGGDVQNSIGLGVRGNWAAEGKVLLMLDGQEMNEIMYSTITFGNRFPVDQIKKIEIIRGPGSSIYGGYAEYGVINIITQNGSDIKGGKISGLYSTTSNGYTHRNGSISMGFHKNEVDISLHGFMGQGQRSDQLFYDGYGNQMNMHGNSDLNPGMVNLGIQFKKFSARGIYENYRSVTRSPFGEIVSKPYENNFRNILAEIKYKVPLHSRFSLTPKVSFKSQQPWNFQGTLNPEDSSYSALQYNKTALRFRSSMLSDWYINSNWNLNAGLEYFSDFATTHLEGDAFINNKRTISFRNYAAFFQLTGRPKILNVIIGARYDNNNAYGSAFVPRVGLTKKYKKFNSKLMYAQSFRAPAIENVNLGYNGEIKPEKSNSVEAEIGYQINSIVYVNTSFYDITTNNPIVYFVDSLDQEGYTNLLKTGTRGVEVSVVSKTKKLYVELTYSYYSSAGKNKVPDYSIAGNNRMVLAFPSHKATLNIQWNITKKLCYSIQGILLGDRYGYSGDADSLSNLPLHHFSPSFLANTYLSYSNIVRGLTVGVGSYNLLNAQYPYIQPYNSGHAAIPYFSRSFVARICYSISKK